MDLAREILLLKFKFKKSNRLIAQTHGISKSTVAIYVHRAKQAGISSLELLEQTDTETLSMIIFQNKSGPKQKINIDFDYVHKELQRKNVTRMLLWKELSMTQTEFYSYGAFCDQYLNWKKSQEITMRIEHKAGEKAFIDYAGTTVPIVVNTQTGEIKTAQIFVACLGCSQYSYVEATWTQNSSDFIASTILAFEFFKGVPEILVPDNLKSGVTTASKYEPVINRSYREMAKHYGTVVIPARARRPKDKAKVENAVLIVSRWILAAIRNETFFSLESLNERITELLKEFNNNPFQKKEGSRVQIYEEIERAALVSLPAQRYENADWKRVVVNIDYHIQLDGSYFSVPYRLRGKELDCRYTSRAIEVFDDGKRVCSHIRPLSEKRTVTNPEHMPKAHREHLEWSPTRMLNWGKSIGHFTEIIFKQMMDSYEHPELAYKGCLGIIKLERRYGKERLENACERALNFGAISYRSVKSILENNLDKVKNNDLGQSNTIEHKNIRGSDYYN